MKLESNNITVVNCSGEADTKVVSSAIAYAKRNEGLCVVVADDTDIAVMLLYHWTTEISGIYFVQQRTLQAWNVRDVEISIPDIKSDLLFLHAWSGCDSTSTIFGEGKVIIVKLLRKSKVLKQISKRLLTTKVHLM